VETLTVHAVFGLSVISLPEELQFETSEVFAFRDGISVVLLPGDPEGERQLRELRNKAIPGDL
jgi:hypothetical protein